MYLKNIKKKIGFKKKANYKKFSLSVYFFFYIRKFFRVFKIKKSCLFISGLSGLHNNIYL